MEAPLSLYPNRVSNPPIHGLEDTLTRVILARHAADLPRPRTDLWVNQPWWPADNKPLRVTWDQPTISTRPGLRWQAVGYGTTITGTRQDQGAPIATRLDRHDLPRLIEDGQQAVWEIANLVATIAHYEAARAAQHIRQSHADYHQHPIPPLLDQVSLDAIVDQVTLTSPPLHETLITHMVKPDCFVMFPPQLWLRERVRKPITKAVQKRLGESRDADTIRQLARTILDHKPDSDHDFQLIVGAHKGMYRRVVSTELVCRTLELPTGIPVRLPDGR